MQKFSPQAVELFMAIEKPGTPGSLPEDDAYETIGQFYEAIGEALQRLSEQLGEQALFCGDPGRQVTDALYYGGGGRIIAVSDLDSARRALAEIVEQGEGIDHEAVWDGDRDMFHPERDEVAHYFRFSEIAHERRYTVGDTPQSGPTGERFSVDWDAVHDMRPNPRSGDYPQGSEIRAAMDEFNRDYCGVLHVLHECFNGSPSLLAVATGAMYALKQQAIELMQLPSGDGPTTVGPSFEYVRPEDRHHTVAGKIVVLRDGPYLVSGDVPLVRKRKLVSENADALTWQKTAALATEETYALCRCGRSSTKPFCDGTHARVGFDGSETADTRDTSERQIVHDGEGIVVRRDGSLCMHAAFCVGRERRIPAMMADTADSDVRAHVMALIERCPSGSYTYALDADGEDIEPDLPVAIAVTTEENELAGALWVTGGVPVIRSDGAPLQTRNRVTLCRCGHSRNKPLCDGTHREIAFTEPQVNRLVATPDAPTTVARRAWQRPALRTDEQLEQVRVTWLELFFDLVFVVVIARLAHHLAGHVDAAGVATFAVQFVAVFWMWNAFTYYTERFESGALEDRLFVFMAIVPVAGLAVFGEQGLGATYVGFALSYLLARAVNQLGWARAAVHVALFRPVAARFVAGYAVVAAVILASFAVTGTARVVLFTLAVALDIATPYFTLAQQAVLPRLSTSKFPERFGLFTMIVLGESVVGVIVGLSELQDRGVLDGPGIVAGVLGLAVGFSLWWIYFDFVARRAPKPVLVMALLWVYLHAAALTAITATGVGVSVAIADTATGSLADPSRYLLVGSVVLGLAGVAALQTTLTRAKDEPTHPRLSPGLKVSVAAVIGTLGVLDLGWDTHALLVLLLVGLALPMTYGAFVWFTQPVTEPASDAVNG